MSVRRGAAAFVGVLVLGACSQRGTERDAEGTRATGIARMASTTSGGVRPGIYPSTVYGNRTNPYANDPAAAAEGRRLFNQYNCSGCHGGRAGGGMGPNLRDSVWTYGSSDVHLFADLVEGRPAGMPAWGGKIPEDQMWKLVSYIHSLATPQEPDPPPPSLTGAADNAGKPGSAGSPSR